MFLATHYFFEATILATRPILLHHLRLRLQQQRATETLTTAAQPLIDTCIRCARRSCLILSSSWVNGAFPALYHDLTQHLFSALTVLAASSLLGHENSDSGREWFDESADLLSRLRDSGNFPAREYYRHVELVRGTLGAAETSRKGGASVTGGDELSEVTGQGSRESVGEEAQVGLGTSIYDGTGETALAEPLLEELLMQSVGAMQFPRTEAGAGYELFAGEGDGGLFWLEFGFAS